MSDPQENPESHDQKSKSSAFQALRKRLEEQIENLKIWAQKAQDTAKEKLEQTQQTIGQWSEALKDKALSAKEQAEIFLLESTRQVHQSTREFLEQISLPKIYHGIIESHLEYVAHKIAEQARGAFESKTDEWLLAIADSVYEFMPLPVRLVFRRDSFRTLCLSQKSRLFHLAKQFYQPAPELPPPLAEGEQQQKDPQT